MKFNKDNDDLMYVDGTFIFNNGSILIEKEVYKHEIAEALGYVIKCYGIQVGDEWHETQSAMVVVNGDLYDLESYEYTQAELLQYATFVIERRRKIAILTGESFYRDEVLDAKLLAR